MRMTQVSHHFQVNQVEKKNFNHQTSMVIFKNNFGISFYELSIKRLIHIAWFNNLVLKKIDS